MVNGCLELFQQFEDNLRKMKLAFTWSILDLKKKKKVERVQVMMYQFYLAELLLRCEQASDEQILSLPMGLIFCWRWTIE